MKLKKYFFISNIVNRHTLAVPSRYHIFARKFTLSQSHLASHSPKSKSTLKKTISSVGLVSATLLAGSVLSLKMGLMVSRHYQLNPLYLTEKYPDEWNTMDTFLDSFVNVLNHTDWWLTLFSKAQTHVLLSKHKTYVSPNRSSGFAVEDITLLNYYKHLRDLNKATISWHWKFNLSK